MHKIIPGYYGMFGQYSMTYNLHHTHHKRESFTQRMRDAFKAWRFKHSNRTSVRSARSR